MDELLRRSGEGWGSFRVDPAKATVARACKEMRDRSMSSFSGSGQFIVTLAALIAAVITICGVCMQPTFTGSVLGWSCLAFVLLLLLAVAIGVVAANSREGVIAEEDIKIVRSSGRGYRGPLDDGCSEAMGVLTCISALAFIGVMIACMCIDYKTRGWGSVVFVAMLALFAMVVVTAEPLRGPTIVQCVPDEVYHVTVDPMPAPNTQQPVVACHEGTGQMKAEADASPGTFVVNIGLDSPGSDSGTVLGSFVVSGLLSPQLQCKV
ncbi:MAG: hypothetical protein AB8U72_04500 [Anaplasma ovis]